MAYHPIIENNQKVTVEIPNVYKFDGVVVGLSQNGLVPIYIVECTDGFLPNETYNYKFCTIPLSYIKTNS